MESKRRIEPVVFDPDEIDMPDDDGLDLLGARSLSEALGEFDAAAALLQPDIDAGAVETASDFAETDAALPIDALSIDQLLASGQRSHHSADAHAETFRPEDFVEDGDTGSTGDLLAPELLFSDQDRDED